jgi:hypothetical protein
MNSNTRAQKMQKSKRNVSAVLIPNIKLFFPCHKYKKSFAVLQFCSLGVLRLCGYAVVQSARLSRSCRAIEDFAIKFANELNQGEKAFIN